LRQIAVERYVEERSLALARRTRRSFRAEERLASYRRREFQLFQQALRFEDELGEHSLRQLAQRTLAIAHAVRSTHEAERKLATEQYKIAKLKLEASTDTMEALDAQLVLAERQMHALEAMISPRVSLASCS
jgi:hypothetical protein